MSAIYPTRIVAVMSLALLLTLSLVTGTLAQGEIQGEEDSGPVVVITRVEGQAFPQVTAYVAVSGEDGLPLEGLTAGNFTLLEDGVEVPAASVVLEKDATQSFSLVLALDISTDPEDLTQLQEAVKSFLDTLGPEDEVAIVTFYDEVKVAQDFTGDKKLLNATINALGAEGNYTALNQAILESATMAGQPSQEGGPSGRRVVVIVTDSADNVKNISIADSVSQILELKVPVYTIGFGPKVRSRDLEEIARLTRGQSFILSSPDEVGNRLQEIEGLLRQGYKLTLQSGLRADNAEHDLSVGVTYQEVEGQALGRFVAVPGEVTVTLSGIADGQQVGQGEVINLTAQVTAPASVVSVEYSLDGQSLAQQDTPPYSFDWDSAGVEPGAYELAVTAVDSAGNEGQAQVGFNVALPLLVTVSTSQEEVQLGNEVTVEAQVEALAPEGVTGVEFLLDGKSLGSDDTPPYSFSFDSSVYLAGEHTVAARAVDSLGRGGEASLAMAFVAPPPEPQPEPEASQSPSWLTILVSGIAGAVIIAALVALILLIRWEKKRYQRAYRLEISNQGNAPSRYELQAQDPTDTFEFEFALGGTSLQQRPVSAAVKTIEAVPVEEPVPVSSAGDAEPGRLEGAREAAGKAAGAGGALASVLSSLSTLLPGSAGRSARRASSRLRRGRMQAQRADYYMSRAAEAKPSAAPSRAAAEPAPRDEVVPAVTRDAQTDQPFFVHAWAQTPLVEPGETLVVDLLVNPIKSYQSQPYSFTLLSRSVEQEEAPSVKEEVSVPMVRPSWLRRLYPYLIVLGVMAVTVVLYIAFLTSGDILG